MKALFDCNCGGATTQFKATSMKTLYTFIVLSLATMQLQAQSWQWATKADGTGIEHANAIAKDNSETIYVCGDFDDVATFGTTALTTAGAKDIFIARYDSSGNSQWAIKAGGTGDDEAKGIATDDAGNVYVAGTFSATAAFGSFSITSNGGVDIFIAKYDVTGTCLWAKQVGSGGTGDCIGIVCDENGNSYISGSFTSAASFDAINLTSNGSSDLYLAHYNSNGDAQWAVATGGYASTVYPRSIAMEGSSIYVCGNTLGNSVFGSDSLISVGAYDMFIAKFDLSGNAIWAKRCGGTATESANACAVNNGSAYMIGTFNGTATFGALSLTSNSGIFLVKYESDGTENFVTLFDALTGQENGTAIAASENGLVIAGSYSSDLIFGNDTLTSTGGGAFVSRLDTMGNVIWAKGSVSTASSSVESNGLVMAGFYTVYLTGYFTGNHNFGSDNLVTVNSSSDAFVAKISDAPTSLYNFENGNSILAYPNPVDDLIIVDNNSSAQKIHVNIFDASGRKVMSREHTGNSRISISTSELTNGIYVCQLISEKHIGSVQIIVQH